ncbi:hypothetical protein GCM10022252_75870 [Streptosporangium oxazolinicum]|uniref:Uncharacterized protein n=1 Tax=Streptosporangium oxazolinicum TaxID=909287 RepID=A0ABP8BKT4_9ACTN
MSFKLANPLGPKSAAEVGLEPKEYPTGSTVVLPYGQAMRLVSAGWVADAEPQNLESVRKALKPVKAKAPAPAPAPAP